MYSLSTLNQEIQTVIEEMESHSRLHPDWITQAVIARHPDVDGNDSDFYQCCTRSGVRDAVRKRLNRYKADPNDQTDAQIVMEGFDRLQKRYLIKENGEQVAVRIECLTRQQILAKALEQERMGYGCFQHAEELRRYAEQAKAAA